ncbi:hypothetical protein ACFWQK_09430 [Brachybacterium paraconglomeratum]
MTEPEASSPIDIEAAANRATARMLGRIGNGDTTDEAASRFSEDVRAEGRSLASEILERASLEISRGCGLDRRNEWRKVLLAWDDTRC